MDGRLMDHYVSSLEVILNSYAEQNSPLIRHELPYSFDVVTKLSPRLRNQEDGEAVAAEAPPPRRRKAPRTAPVHATAPQSVGPSGQGQLSYGDSRGPPNSTSSHISKHPTVLASNPGLSSPVEIAMSCRQPITTAVEGGPMIEDINPSRGPTAGGRMIWIECSGIPTTMPLYARFGDNFTHVVGTLIIYFYHHLIEPRLFENPI